MASTEDRRRQLQALVRHLRKLIRSGECETKPYGSDEHEQRSCPFGPLVGSIDRATIQVRRTDALTEDELVGRLNTCDATARRMPASHKASVGKDRSHQVTGVHSAVCPEHQAISRGLAPGCVVVPMDREVGVVVVSSLYFKTAGVVWSKDDKTLSNCYRSICTGAGFLTRQERIGAGHRGLYEAESKH